MATEIEVHKTMFEIYRESTYGDRYRVVYFTELNDHNKESEINRAMAGESVFDGYIRDSTKARAKKVIDGLLRRLNDERERIEREEVQSLLVPFLVD